VLNNGKQVLYVTAPAERKLKSGARWIKIIKENSSVLTAPRGQKGNIVPPICI